MREIVTIEMDEALLHGTVHRGTGPRETGILFLNSGAQPRCSRGDLSVHLADSLAERGFLCFRVDLPGLGDSDGKLPTDFASFYQLVQAGACAPCAGRLAATLRKHYGLSGMILLGICGGALTGLFAAADPDTKDGIAGLILLELPFAFVSVRHQATNTAIQDRNNLLSRARCSVRRWKTWLHDWVLAQSWEPYATSLYYRLKKLRGASLAPRSVLPANTNMRVVEALCLVLRQRVPTLLITAHPPGPEPPVFDYVGHVGRLVGRAPDHVRVRGTTHSFIENGGADAVLTAVSDWLKRCETPSAAAEVLCNNSVILNGPAGGIMPAVISQQ